MARLALENVLARLSDEQERKSLTEAVDNTIAGKPVPKVPAEGEINVDPVPNF